ncbi:Serine/threonine kinase, partial [Coemansia sp. RSA 1804]
IQSNLEKLSIPSDSAPGRYQPPSQPTSAPYNPYSAGAGPSASPIPSHIAAQALPPNHQRANSNEFVPIKSTPVSPVGQQQHMMNQQQQRPQGMGQPADHRLSQIGGGYPPNTMVQAPSYYQQQIQQAKRPPQQQQQMQMQMQMQQQMQLQQRPPPQSNAPNMNPSIKQQIFQTMQQPLQQQQQPMKGQVVRKVGADDFKFVKVLGKGNFGKVMLSEEKSSNKLYAIKVLKKEFIVENDEFESTRSEKRVLLIANKEQHPFLIGLHSCFQSPSHIFFVMEYISGGDLMMHVQKLGSFGERRAKFFACEVLLGLAYFHKAGIIYRDLKLDNIMLDNEGHVKIADYGLCKENMGYGQTTITFCGTPEFMAPEIVLEQRYGRAVDWWAFGVLIYEMILGTSPFHGEDENEIFDSILEDEILYPVRMSRDSVFVCQALLERDPSKRLGAGPNDAEDIMKHSFFAGINWDDVLNKRIPPPYVPEIRGRYDVSNFDPEFTNERPGLTPTNTIVDKHDQKEFADFDYVSPWAGVAEKWTR